MKYNINSTYIKFLIICPVIICYMLLYLDNDSVVLLTVEDGIIESIGATLFLICSVFFFINFKISRNIGYLFFGILFLFGFFEEISWGQRIIGFETPKFFQEYNLQNEFNIHNLKWFHGRDTSGSVKSFWGKFLNMDRLFSVFWFSYCVVIPILNKYSSKFAGLIKKISLPIIPVFLSALFLMNYLVSKLLEAYFKDLAHPVIEIKEANFSYLFALFSIFELIKLMNEKTNFDSGFFIEHYKKEIRSLGNSQ